MFLRAGVTAAVLAVAVAITGPADAANQSVMALSSPNRFAPQDVTVNQGETVTWTNGGGLHNVQFDNGTYEMPADPSTSGWTVSRRFDTAGRFTYICREHGSSMSGSVTVVANGEPEPPPSGSPPPDNSPPGSGTPGPEPPTDAPSPLPLINVTLKVSDATPAAGRRIRVFGVVRPARDGRRVQIQKRARNGDFHTVATARLQDAGAAKSEFTVRLRVGADAVFRARVGGDAERGAGVSRPKKVDVHR